MPDCEAFLEDGDASVLFHEHFSYFTAASLAATLRNVGATSLRVRRSSLSKLLFATFSFGGSPDGTRAPEDVPFDRPLVSSLALAHGFRAAVSRTSGKLAAYLAEARALGESVAVYVPGRFVNYVPLAGLSLEGIRFFDDSTATHGRYFPGISVAVESGDALVANPTKRVLVMSTSFGRKIKARLAPKLPPGTRITTLDELLRGERA